MSKNYVTIKIPEATKQEAKADSRTYEQIMQDGLGKERSNDVQLDEAEVAKQVEERLQGSKPLAEMEFEDWFEPDYAKTIATHIESELLLSDDYGKEVAQMIVADLKTELPAKIAEEMANVKHQ